MELKPLPADSYKHAREVMVSQEFFGTQQWRNQKGRADRSYIHSEIEEFTRKFIAKLKANGMPFYAHCIFRSPDKQHDLFEKGYTKAQAGFSPHQYSMAVDIVHSQFHWELPSRKCWELIGYMGQEVAYSAGIDIVWGGNWKFWDPAHWELADWQYKIPPERKPAFL